jgi:lysophospholipase L1-like esterase
MRGLDSVLERFLKFQRTRIVAFGSSNTEARNVCRFNWFDWLDAGIAKYYGRVHTSINTGMSGDTSRGLLGRFDEDVTLYRPHLVIITIGGNDANPENEIREERYADNLRELAARVRTLDACVLFQTYYSCDLDRMDPPYARNFQRYMQIIRDVATEVDVDLIDHHRHWERLRESNLALYRSLMHDPMHVNPLGNMLMGLDVMRALKVKLGGELKNTCAEGLKLQGLLDAAGGQPPQTGEAPGNLTT